MLQHQVLNTSVKDTFYSDLEIECTNSVPNHDMLIVVGDWNAHIGKSDDNIRHIIRNYRLGNQCDNGDRLIN